MYTHKTKLRVRYGETDQMKYAYYGVYAQYFEVGRVELLRSLGITYNVLEELGFSLPVVNYNIDYKKPAFYDDELTIETTIKEAPSMKIVFNYRKMSRFTQKHCRKDIRTRGDYAFHDPDAHHSEARHTRDPRWKLTCYLLRELDATKTERII